MRLYLCWSLQHTGHTVHTAALRSRIQGEGYEILMKTTMPDTEENEAKIAQFVAQEIEMDGRIPHATRGLLKFSLKMQSEEQKL